jgi:uncharacterized NAD-dependent epimerase/dehydratase family protein
MNNALVLTNGLYCEPAAKTAHGLVRGTERFTIVGLIDNVCAGQEAGDLLDGKNRNIPIVSSIDEFFEKFPQISIDYLIIGVATLGGKIPDLLKPALAEVIKKGISVVSGLHEYLNDDPYFIELAKISGAKLLDIRKPKPFEQLHSWTGDIKKVTCPRIAVLGTDMNMGKRTTTRFLTEAFNKIGVKAEMIYTGQTGWMQGSKYGFVLDSTLNDFVSGEMEHAVVSCWENEMPEIMFIEGQSSLRNPAGPCGAEYLLSAEAKGVVLQHAPKREFFRHQERAGNRIPNIESEIELIKMYGAEVIAVTFNTMGLSLEEAKIYQKEYREKLNIPVVLPKEEGVEEVVIAIQNWMKK